MNIDPKNSAANRIKPEYFFWAAIVLALFGVVYGKPDVLPAEQTVAAAVAAPAAANPYDRVDLLAEAAVVYDVQGDTFLFQKNATTSLPLASITKIMTGTVALSLVPETTLIPISAKAVAEEGDSGLKVGEKWLLRDLVPFMLVQSSNDAAAAISTEVGKVAAGTEDSDVGREFFIRKMNAEAAEMGLTATRFTSASGLDTNLTEAGAYASAEDTARLLAHALQRFPAIFAKTRWSELKLQNGDGEAHSAQNTNTDTDKLPLLIASKTGYTDLAGGNLVIAFDAGFNRPFIVAVLGSTAEGRFTDVEKLVWSTLEYLAQAR